MAKKELPQIKSAKLYITASFNNTLVSLTDLNGNVISWGSTGASGFKGARKATPFAATTAIDKVVKAAKEVGVTSMQVFIKGPGAGRDAALGVIKASGIKVGLIADITPMPHNGCRPKKRRHG
ncbi:MAG: 30S ribosomal protein S11 [Candidatus Beckwithbacteria bacterium]|nr:30S ribosomal protein S11 [Candidatus Beckwithbacteria bacterium]